VKKTLQLKFNPETNKLIRFVYDMPLGNVSTATDVIHLDLPELEWLYSQAVTELWRIESIADVRREQGLRAQGTRALGSRCRQASTPPRAGAAAAATAAHGIPHDHRSPARKLVSA
jgi:hypothetical protein